MLWACAYTKPTWPTVCRALLIQSTLWEENRRDIALKKNSTPFFSLQPASTRTLLNPPSPPPLFPQIKESTHDVSYEFSVHDPRSYLCYFSDSDRAWTGLEPTFIIIYRLETHITASSQMGIGIAPASQTSGFESRSSLNFSGIPHATA